MKIESQYSIKIEFNTEKLHWPETREYKYTEIVMAIYHKYKGTIDYKFNWQEGNFTIVGNKRNKVIEAAKYALRLHQNVPNWEEIK